MAESKGELLKKLVAIQGKLNAPKNQVNKFGGFNYRSCEDILQAVKPLLGDLALTLSDEVVNIGERFYIKATARITDGTEVIETTAYARESLEKKGMDESQVTGSSSSYARKYALNGLFAIDDGKDADSDDNSKKGTGAKTAPQKPQGPTLASEAQRAKIFALFKDLEIESEKGKEIIKEHFKLESFTNITMAQASKAIESLTKKVTAKQAKEEDIDLDEVDKAIS